MEQFVITNALVYTGHRFVPREVYVEEGRVAQLAEKVNAPAGCPRLDLGGKRLVPGFIDIHTHGAMGRDFSDGDPEALAVTSRYYAENGVTSFLATTMTLKEPQLLPAMACVKNAGALPGARCAGVNLEGPFLSYAKRGAQNPDNLHKPDADMFMRLHEASGGAVKLVTVAPEEEGGLEFVKRVSPVCTVSVGHTEADYDTAMRAYEAGASHATHLFNGMPGLHHRNPGVIGAAFDAGATVELICDGLHICDEMLGIYFKVKSTDKFMMVSDCTALSGAPVGKYEGIFEGMALNVTPEGFVLTDTGRLCGSSQPVLFDIGNLVNNVGIPLETCLKMACLNPCIKYGFADRKGTIEVGKDADLVVISDDYQAQVTYAEGRKVYDRSTEGKIFNADYLNR